MRQMQILRIQPLDPLMIRDGRPFDMTPGIKAYSLDDVSPSVLAGTICTLLGKYSRNSTSIINGNRNIYRQLSSKDNNVIVRGPLYEKNRRVFYPVPQDVVFYNSAVGKGNEKLGVDIRRPVQLQEGEGFYGVGTNGLHENLLWLPMSRHVHKESSNSPAYMSATLMYQWLQDTLSEADWSRELEQWSEGQSSNSDLENSSHFIGKFPREERVHTAIDHKSYTAQDQQLFSTESIILPDGMSMLAAVELSTSKIDWPGELSLIHSLGGKRRLAHFSEVVDNHNDSSTPWKCPESILNVVGGKTYIRMVLATPAYFAKGWLPGGFNEELVYENAWGSGVNLKLLSACISKWQPVSGWRYGQIMETDTKGKSADKSEQSGREKSIRRLVPAGSVYFFEIESGNAEDLVKKMWLVSVSDKNRRKAAFDDEDGFGLALWGVWDPNKMED